MCPDCDGHVVENTSESYCEGCGLVVDDAPINHGIDWDENEEWMWDKSHKRTGSPGRFINGDVQKTSPTKIGDK